VTISPLPPVVVLAATTGSVLSVGVLTNSHLDGKKGTEKGTKQGTEKGTKQGTKQGTEKGTEKGTKQGTEKGTKQGTEKGTEKGTKQGTEKGTEQGTEKGTKHHVLTQSQREQRIYCFSPCASTLCLLPHNHSGL
jgi:flagellar biosynthesis/type III secretory pathway protein FliH